MINMRKHLGGEIANKSHVFSEISTAANSSVFVMGCNGTIQLPFTLSDLLDRKKVRSIIKTHGGKSIELYEIFRERTNMIIISEKQIGANANIFSDRSPSLRNQPSWEFGHDCGLYGFGLIGYAFLGCIGFCGKENCARTIQRKALQILYTFIKNAKKRFLQRRKQMSVTA